MKRLLLVLLTVLITAGIFVYTDPQLQQDADNMLQHFLSATGVDTKSATAYKWKDANGVPQYTQTRPPQGTTFEKVEARSDVNLMPLPDELKPE